jgi:hypothetical protein
LSIDHTLGQHLTKPLPRLQNDVLDFGQGRARFRFIPVKQFVNYFFGLSQQLGFHLGAGA